MKYNLWFAVTATSILSIVPIQAHPSLQMNMPPQPPLMTAEPTQNQCPQLRTLKSNPNSNTEKIRNWSVVKVTKMMETSGGQNPQNPGQLQNSFCDMFSDVSDCVGISYTVTSRANNGFTAQTFAYNDRYPNLQVTERTFSLADPSFQIWSVKNNNAQMVTTAIDQSATPQETLFGAIAENANGAWKMFALCDQSLAWVAAPADELKNNPKYLDNYKAEIEGALQQIKTNLSSMSQGAGVMNTNIEPASTSVQDPLPIVSIFGSPSSMGAPPNAYPSTQLGTKQQQYGTTNSPPDQVSDPNMTIAQPAPPPNVSAYASVGAPVPPPPPTMYSGYGSPPPMFSPNTSPASQPPGSVAYASVGAPTSVPSPPPPPPPPAMYSGYGPPPPMFSPNTSPASQPSGSVVIA